MKHESEKEFGLSFSGFLRCVGLEVETEAAMHVRVRKMAGQAPDQQATEDQIDVIDAEIVEDIDPAEVKKLEKL